MKASRMRLGEHKLSRLLGIHSYFGLSYGHISNLCEITWGEIT